MIPLTAMTHFLPTAERQNRTRKWPGGLRCRDRGAGVPGQRVGVVGAGVLVCGRELFLHLRHAGNVPVRLVNKWDCETLSSRPSAHREVPARRRHAGRSSPPKQQFVLTGWSPGDVELLDHGAVGLVDRDDVATTGHVDPTVDVERAAVARPSRREHLARAVGAEPDEALPSPLRPFSTTMSVSSSVSSAMPFGAQNPSATTRSVPSGSSASTRPLGGSGVGHCGSVKKTVPSGATHRSLGICIASGVR